MIRVPVPALLALGCLPLLGACTSAPTGIRVETGPDVRWNLLIEQ